MLTLYIDEQEIFDEETDRFIKIDATTINLEHSLVSLSKWEAKYHKPFLTKEEKTPDEVLDYIKFMDLSEKTNPFVFRFLNNNHVSQIQEYIQNPMSATTIKKKGGPPNREIITSEIIYYWMIALQVPTEFQYWHLNRLLTLIEVVNIKNEPPKKMSRSQILAQNAALNAERRAKLHTKG